MNASSPYRATISSLPKAELHIHIEGTLEPDLAFRLAARNDVALPFTDETALHAAYRFRDLQSFLDLYYRCSDVLRHEADFYALAAAYLRRAHADGVRHAEIFFDPQSHLIRGVQLGEVINGLAKAIDNHTQATGTTAALIACFLRDRSAEEAMRVLEALSEYRTQVIGVGLDSAEVGNPPSKFAQVFAAAGELGFRRVAHAGEEGPAEYIWQALDVLGAERIDHGIRAATDRTLMARLAADRIPLTVCPLSNVRLRCVDTLADHPLPTLLENGVLVTLNSDDPAYFGGYVGDNYAAVAQAFALGEGDIAALAANSLQASFTSAL